MKGEPIAASELACKVWNFDEAAQLGELRMAAVGTIDVGCYILGMKARPIWVRVAMDKFDQLECDIPAIFVVNKKSMV